MTVSQWVQAHRRSILLLLAMLATAGLIATFRLPVSLFPTVDFPRVSIQLDAGDRPAEQMALEVTVPVEEAVRRVPGVVSLRSTTSRGSADVSVNFNWGADMAAATLQINAAINQIQATLPSGAQFQTRRMDPTVFPIIAYSLTSPNRPLTELHDLAAYQLRPLLAGIEGIARVEVQGGEQEEYHVTADPQRLAAYGLTIADLSQALSATNVLTAVGRLEDHYKLYLLVSDTRLKTIDDIRNIVIRTGGDGLVRLRDVAEVEDSTAPQWIRVTADGKQAVLLQIYQQPGSNSVQIAKDVQAKLAAYRGHIPKDVRLANWYDQSVLVVESAKSVRDAILIGIGLAAAVLMLFLRNWRITLIAIAVVPSVLATTVVMLGVFGMSFNIMTLGGMAAAVGLIIDDAIVMIEHIVRRLHEGGDVRENVGRAAIEFARPLAGSSASTIVIFIPLAFLTGVTGAFFKALSLTMAAGLLISFFVTWLAVPILAERFLGGEEQEKKEKGSLAMRFDAGYERLMGRLLGRPVLVLLLIVPLLGLGYFAYTRVGSGFMPSMDEGGFILDYRAPPGTSLTETDRLLRQVEQIIRTTPEVETYSRRTGTQLGGGLTESYEGDFFVRLKPPPRRSIDDVMDDIRGKVERNVPGLDIELAQLMEDVIGDLTAVPQPIEIKLFSDNPAQLLELAPKVAGAIGKINGVVDVKDGINPAGDALEIHIDRTRAAFEGVDPDAVTRMLNDYLSGNVATQVERSVKMVGVRVWTPAGIRKIDGDLGNLPIRAADGHLFPLKHIAQITAVTGQPQIDRENLKRMVAVTARISGRDLGSAIADVKQVMNAKNLVPEGVTYELGGLYEQQQIAFHGLMLVFGAAVALVLLLLVFLYERLRIALAILAIPLLASSAVFIGLWLTGIELNITAIMGMTMIIGITTEVAIFYTSEYQEMKSDGSGEIRAALIGAGKNRVRPIAMTTIAAILTLLPLAFALGQGSGMQQPLAIAIISGLVVQLPLVLVVMPVLFYLVRPRKKQ